MRNRPQPFAPTRPWLQPGFGESRLGYTIEPFPERHLDQVLDADPPRILASIEEIFRGIALLDGTEPEWRLAPIEAEIDSIRAAFGALGLGPGSLIRLRFGAPSTADAARFRRAAILSLRWGLALMRTGDVNQRVWGGARLQEARTWDPENPIPVLVHAGYLRIGGFWANERDELDRWAHDHESNEAVDLQRLRGRERVWKVERDRGALLEALRLGREIAGRQGGWGRAPAWLNLEYARLLLQADSLRAAESAARRSLRNAGGPGASDLTSAAQAELLLGVIAVRRLDYSHASERFQSALELGASEPSLQGLVSWMRVPWDLWTRVEQQEFDSDPDRASRIDQWWRRHDPVLATTRIQEDRIEYLARVGEAWFALEGVDVAVPGPLTDPGQMILRYGKPDHWSYSGGENGFRGIQFLYQHLRPDALARRVSFRSNVAGTRFTATDSLRGPDWPDWLPRYGFEDRDYRLNTATEVLRHPAGGARLVFCYDTWLPEYSVRYPLQGIRFEGQARVQMLLMRSLGDQVRPVQDEDLVLDRESVVAGTWLLRRRSGLKVFELESPAVLRLATQLTLRDTEDRVVAMAVDNGRDFVVGPFSGRGLDASSLMLLSALPDSLDHRQEWETTPGCLASGPDFWRSHLEPRADRSLLQGEELAFYFEVYNLSRKDGLTDAELSVEVEHLDKYGDADYSVGTHGPTMALDRRNVCQWNIARSMGPVNLEPGTYRLRVNVYDRRAERRVERLAEFDVTIMSEMVERLGWRQMVLPEGVIESFGLGVSGR